MDSSESEDEIQQPGFSDELATGLVRVPTLTSSSRVQNKVAYDIINDTRKRWYIISINNPYKQYWDAAVILSAIFTSFFVPVEIAFEGIDKAVDKFWFTHALDVLVDVIFLIDIVAGFLTEYTDVVTGDQIRNPKKIAKGYMKSGFFFDAISSVPFIVESFVPIDMIKKVPIVSSWLSVFRIFKLVRLRKIGDAIAHMTHSKETKTQLRRIVAILALAIVMHV